MAKNDLWISFLQRMFSADPFSDFGTQDFEEDENTETMVFNKGNYRTEVKVYFNEKGMLKGWSSKAEFVETEDTKNQRKLKSLEERKQKAIELEDFTLAAELRDEIRQLKEPAKQIN